LCRFPEKVTPTVLSILLSSDSVSKSAKKAAPILKKTTKDLKTEESANHYDTANDACLESVTARQSDTDDRQGSKKE